MSLHAEPVLEPCMKVQRISGVNGTRENHPKGWLIRVVPPKDIRSFGPLLIKQGPGDRFLISQEVFCETNQVTIMSM